MRNFLRKLGQAWVRSFGSVIRDDETGEVLGRALIFVWRGTIHVVGFTGGVPLRPVFRGQDRVRYWRQSIGFTRHSAPDFSGKQDQ